MLKKIKKSAGDLFNSEKIGEVEMNETSPLKINTEQMPINDEDIDPSLYIKTDKVGAGKSRTMIINELNLHNGSTLTPELLTSEDVDNQEFTITLPEGLSFDEVEAFCSVVMETVDNYRNIIKSLEHEKESLIEEVLRIDRQALEQKNQSQIDSILKHGNDEKERLQDSVIELQTALSKVQKENKLLKSNKSSNIDEYKDENSKLKEVIATLKNELNKNNNEDEINDLRLAKNEKDNEINKLKNIISSLKENTKQNNESLIEEKDEEIKVLTEMLNETKENEVKMERLKQQLNKKEKELNEIKTAINKKTLNSEKPNSEIVNQRTDKEIEKELLNNEIDPLEAKVMEEYLLRQKRKQNMTNNKDLELLKKSEKEDVNYL